MVSRPVSHSYHLRRMAMAEFDYRKEEIRKRYKLDINRNLTFAGAMVKYFFNRPEPGEKTGANGTQYTKTSVLEKHITDETMRRYIDELIDRVIPMLEPGSMTMMDYDLSYFERALQRIKSKYALETMDSYRRNIRRIYNVWADNQTDLENRIIWPEEQPAENTKTSNKKRCRQFSTPRSIGIYGEMEIFKWMHSLNIETINKTDLGILLMFFLGLRNNEAAGRTFGDIREIPGTPYHCIYVTSSTKGQGRELKVGGKTSNAFRIVPLYDFFYSLLMERRDFIIKKWKDSDPSLKDIDIEKRIESQRIAADVFDNSGVSSPDLTKRGKEILIDVLGKAKNEISFKDAEYDYRYGIQKSGLEDEDSPTTYLFRRNFATHAANLELSPSQIEYIIGHNIEELGVSRHFFSTGEELAEIAGIMQKHPFCLLERIITKTEDYSVDYTSQVIFRGHIQQGEQVKAILMANEPLDDIGITVQTCNRANISGKRIKSQLPHGYPLVLDMTGKTLMIYRQKAKEYLYGKDT